MAATLPSSSASPLQCELCQQHFSSRNQLFRHLREAHPTSPSPQQQGHQQQSSEPSTLSLHSSSSGKSSRSGRVARRRRDRESGGDAPRLSSLEGFYRRAVGDDGLTLDDAQVGSRNKDTQKPETVVLYGLNKNESVKGRYTEGMSCPILKARISKLEDRGLVAEFQKKLLRGSGDMHSTGVSDYVQQMEVAHRLYAEERWRRLTPADVATVEKNKWVYNLRDVGVAGMRNANAVKCLHCHYAHFLARPEHGNIIGKWTHEALLACDNIEDSTSHHTSSLSEAGGDKLSEEESRFSKHARLEVKS